MLIQRVSVLVATASAVILLSSCGWQASAWAAQDEEGNKGSGSGDVALRIAGDKGTSFSGTCSAGKEEQDISRRVPQSFEYDLNGQELQCEIRKQGDESGELEVVLSSDDTRSVQRVEGEDVTLRLTYAKGSVSSSTTSVSGGQATNSISSQVSSSSSSSQTVISSGNSSSSSEANDDVRGGGDDAKSRAERIIERIFKEVGLGN
jgi:hypothetical protein